MPGPFRVAQAPGSLTQAVGPLITSGPLRVLVTVPNTAEIFRADDMFHAVVTFHPGMRIPINLGNATGVVTLATATATAAAATLEKSVIGRIEEQASDRVLGSAPALRPVAAGVGLPARVVVELDPQHVGESADPSTDETRPITGRLAGPSRLAFDLPTDAANPLGGPLADLLTGLSGARGHVAPAAIAPQAPANIVRPAADATAIEIPWRVVMSPGPDAVWQHEGPTRTVAGRVILWHTRLRPAAGATGPTPIRAVFSDDYPSQAAGTADVTTPLDQQRGDLVGLTTEFGSVLADGQLKPTGQPYVPQSIRADTLILTPLGGTISADASFPAVFRNGSKGQFSSALVGWSMRAAQARTTFEKAVIAGRLAPFGHLAALTVIVHRHVVNGKAQLVSHAYLTVTQPIVRFPLDASGLQRLRFPFVEAEVPAGPFEITIPAPTAASLVTLPGSTVALRLPVRLRDGAGRDATGTIAVVFAPLSANGAAIPPGKLAEAFTQLPPGLRTIECQGAPMRLAEPLGNGSDNTTFHVDRLLVDCEMLASDPAGTIMPVVAKLEVEVPGSAEFAGGRQTMPVSFASAYLTDPAIAATANPGGVILARSGTAINGAARPAPVLFALASDVSSAVTGGIAVATMAVHGLSRATGAVTGAIDQADAALALAANPSIVSLANSPLLAALPDIQILGFVPLRQLVRTVAKASDALPRIQREIAHDTHTVTMALNFHIASDTIKLGPVSFVASNLDFALTTKAQLALGTGISTTTIDASITSFQIVFDLGIGGIALNFAKLGFSAAPSAKPDFVCDLDKSPLTFTGALRFVNTLIQLIPSSAFSDPPDVQVTASGVAASYALPLPPLQFGAFALSNLALEASFHLPFIGARPSLKLSLADRANPFSLLVACLGGGGYVAIELDTGGLRAFELTLEAQAGIVLTVPAAKGAVMARVGIYFRLEVSTAATVLTFEAFVEISGAVCVLGILTVSVVCSIVLGYQSDTNRLYGIGTVSVGIKLLFVKKTVSFQIERTFSGGGADPAFADVYALDTFAQYTGAFAE